MEPHHIRRLTDGGPDDPRAMGAVCPNCHREIHHGTDGQKRNLELQARVTRKETAAEEMQPLPCAEPGGPLGKAGKLASAFRQLRK